MHAPLGGNIVAPSEYGLKLTQPDDVNAEKVVDIIADDDRVVTRYISTGTHEGEFQGIAPTGRVTTISEVSIHRLLDGKIVEQWGFPDGLSHAQQLTADLPGHQ